MFIDGWFRCSSGALGETQHCGVLGTTYRKTFEQRQKVVHTSVGQTPHSIKLNTVMCYARLTAKHWSDDGRLSTQVLGSPTLDETRHCNVLRTTHRKALEQRRKVVHTGVG